ncbi:MAG: hypothetical protein RL307_1007, partial [Pseudomonadota bacterium]
MGFLAWASWQTPLSQKWLERIHQALPKLARLQ